MRALTSVPDAAQNMPGHGVMGSLLTQGHSSPDSRIHRGDRTGQANISPGVISMDCSLYTDVHAHTCTRMTHMPVLAHVQTKMFHPSVRTATGILNMERDDQCSGR